MAKIERSQQAEQDLIDLWTYIAEDNPAAADNLLDQIVDVKLDPSGGCEERCSAETK